MADDEQAWKNEACIGASQCEPAEPHWTRGVPLCDEDCRHHDGKRCKLQGFRPGTLCEPVVHEMGLLLTKARKMVNGGR